MHTLTTKLPPNAQASNSADCIPVFYGERADDIEAFGDEAALALTELPLHIAELNRTYRRVVAQRALWKMPAMETWRHHMVNVFLRHDAVYVFAIHHHSHVGMANFVELHNVSFVVDAVGRDQTLRKTGTLPNLSTVHAYVSGEMTGISDELPTGEAGAFPLWHPVYYRPDRDSSFMTSLHPTTDEDHVSLVLQPVTRATRVRMIPGRIKVWCQQPGCTETANDSSVRSGEGI